MLGIKSKGFRNTPRVIERRLITRFTGGAKYRKLIVPL
jgi:hypothetical protein